MTLTSFGQTVEPWNPTNSINGIMKAFVTGILVLAVAVALASAAPRPEDKETLVPVAVIADVNTSTQGTPADNMGLKQNPIVDAFNNLISNIPNPLANVFSNGNPAADASGTTAPAANPAQGVLDAINNVGAAFSNTWNSLTSNVSNAFSGATQPAKAGETPTTAAPVADVAVTVSA